MRPNFPFLSAASNALLKSGGLLRWKVQLVKDAVLFLLARATPAFLPTALSVALRLAGAELAPSAIPCSLFPLISRIHSSLFSDWRCTASSKFFDSQVPSISTEELVLPRHARCVLSRLRCNGHSLLLSSISLGLAESRILPAAPADTSHLILHCPATDSLRRSLFGHSLSLYDLRPRPWGVARLLGLHGLPPCPQSLARGRVTNNNNP